MVYIVTKLQHNMLNITKVLEFDLGVFDKLVVQLLGPYAFVLHKWGMHYTTNRNVCQNASQLLYIEMSHPVIYFVIYV